MSWVHRNNGMVSGQVAEAVLLMLITSQTLLLYVGKPGDRREMFKDIILLRFRGPTNRY